MVDEGLLIEDDEVISGLQEMMKILDDQCMKCVLLKSFHYAKKYIDERE